jgi:hypothetical protein
VRITYMLRKYRHYTSSYWSWVAVRADFIDPVVRWQRTKFARE